MSRGTAGYLRRHGLEMDQNIPKFLDNWPQDPDGRAMNVSGVNKVSLAIDGDAPGNGLAASWQNPHSVAVIITGVYVTITTIDATETIDIGPGTALATTNDELIDGLSVGVAGQFNNMDNPGSNGLFAAKLDANGGTTDWLTATLSAGSDTTVGTIEFTYIKAG